MFYLTVLEWFHIKSNGTCIWFFCTRDQVLLKIASYRDAVTPKKIGAFIDEYYPGEGVEAVNDYMNKINCRRDRAGHIAKVCANLDTILDGLVKEVLAC